MRVAGIIAEYNPFHNGHLYHLRRTKAETGADVVVAVMSGNFVQRGEAAFLDKWTRARMAVDNGVNLVLELPFAFACNNAEYFAKGAIRLLGSLGCVTHLSFGSESGDLARLSRVAEFISREPDIFKDLLVYFGKQGYSFPKARYEAVREMTGDADADLLNHPNNILAIEYLKQLTLTESSMQPTTIARYGAGYTEAKPEAGQAGASAIRSLFLAGQSNEAMQYLPENSVRVLCEEENRSFVAMQHFYQMISYAVRSKDVHELADIFSATEGLENRAKTALETARDMDSLITAIKSKRYTETRVKRFLMHILFGLDRYSMRFIDEGDYHYCRVLAFDNDGAALLKKLQRSTECPHIITNLGKSKQVAKLVWPLLRYDVLASDLYNLASQGEMSADSDYRKRPYVKQ